MSRNLVICCDGTNNEIAGHQTNVLRLFRMLKRGDEQVVFYDSGVGTCADPTAQRYARQPPAWRACGTSLSHSRASSAERVCWRHFLRR